MFENIIVNRLGERKPMEEEVRKVTFKPAADIFETDNQVILQLEMPNVDKKSLKVFIREGMLHIEGKKQNLNIENGSVYLVRETRPVQYERIFELDPEIDKTNITAKYENGLLTISLNKKEREEQKKIEIR